MSIIFCYTDLNFGESFSPTYLEQVAADVDALFAGRLDPAAITVGRYYAGAEEPLPFSR